MFDISLRQWKDFAADPVARGFPSWISPGQVTAVAFVAGILACLTATSPSASILALVFWAVNRFLDCVDGSLARHRNLTSDLGGFLDLLGDFIVYSILPIAVGYGQDHGLRHVDWVSIAFLEATFHINNFILFFSAAVAAQKDDRELTSVTMRPALIEGFESGLLFTAMLIWPKLLNMWARIMSIGVVIGIVQRTVAIVAVLESRRTEEATRNAVKGR
jgi:phosphatidylglycerophosphate synthase